MAYTDVKDHYKGALQSNPYCATDWHNKGLTQIEVIEKLLHDETQMAQKYKLTLASAAFVLSKQIHHAQDAELYSNALRQWSRHYVTNLKIIDQHFAETIGNAYKSTIQYFHQAIHACDERYLRNRIKLELIECLAQYGHYLYKREEYKKAQRYYQQTLKLDPDHITALNQMGMSLSKEQLYAEARIYFEEILARVNSTTEKAHAWLNIAYTYRLQNNYRKAAKTLREAQRLAPRDTDILEEEKRLKALISSLIFPSINTRLSTISTYPLFNLPISENEQDALINSNNLENA